MSDERGVEPVAPGADVAEEVREALRGRPQGPGEELEVEIVSFGDEDAAPAEDAATAPDSGAERLGAELAELRDRFLRLRADFDNYRKRMAREREEQARRALAEPILELLPVLDNLERALESPAGGEELRRGVELTAKQFVDTLRRFGLAEIPALGQPFDPQVHEAVAREESPDVEEATVVGELARGYWLDGRLLRPAMVRVAVPPAAPPPAVEESE